MPRLPRIYIEGSLYYITCRSLPNQKIFREKGDYEMYFGLLKKYKEELGVKIFAYTLMPSHLHLLCEVDNKTSVSTIMHNLNSSYTKYYNGRYSRKGHLFRERFKAAVIEKDPHLLLNITAHIHLNPQRLNLSLQAQSYPYSSYGLYLDYYQQTDHGLDIKAEIEELVSALIGENYNDFIERLSQTEEYKKMHKKLQRKKIVGSDEFIAKVKDEIEHQQEVHKEEAEAAAENKEKVLVQTGTAVLMFVLTVAGIYVYFHFSRLAPKLPAVSQKVISETLQDLDQTEWQTQLTKSDGTPVSNDVMSFKAGKFSSAYLAQFAFPHTNYSMAVEGDTIIWETMQTSPQGTASWRGEVTNGHMQGILSLRQEGKQPQDFYFKSVKFWRR